MKKLKKIISLILSTIMVMGFVPQHTFADGFAAYVTDASGKTTHYTSFRSAWNYAVSINNAIVGTNESYLNHAGENSYVVPEGKTVTVELNGHYLCRNITSSMDDGNVFNVQNNATLIVYGGNKDNPAYNSGESHTQSVYLPTSDRYGYEKADVTLYGGLIYGGNCCNGGGGIMMGERSNVHLHNVTVAGNYADSYFLKWGDGGGVYMNGKYGRLYMTDSRICYNCAHDDGGGILVCEDYCTINMVRSHIDHNVADDDGGGIFVEGENFKLCGDAKQFRDPEAMITTYGINNWDGAYNYFIPDMLGSSVSYNCVYHSETGGGGIYLEEKTALIEGVNIAGNYANDSWTDGYGGGIYVDDKEITIRNCNILRNKANAKGGGIYEDGGESAVDCCTVYGNMAWGNSGCGGGIYVSASNYLAVSGPVIVNENQSQINGTLDNLYLDTGNDGEIDTTSFLIPSTTPGADIHVRLSPARTKRIHISKNPGTYDITHFSYDNDNTHYIGWGENTHRYLSVVEGTKPQPPEVVTFTPDNGKRTQSAGSYAGYPLIKGVFSYPSFPDDNADVENVFYYSDGFFAGDPNTYNEHLATASLCLAASAGYSNIPNADGKIYEGNALTVRNDYLDKSKNFRQFVSDIGCKDENIYVNDFNLQKPGADTIGVGIASKPIFDDKTLVIIGVRGMGYESEWISNMTLGSTGEAAGWSSAATQVMAELTDYLARKRINGSSENTIFWIAGYSRAGATSNLTAKRIVDTYDNNGTHTFAYPLEAPMGGVESNIIAGHNYNCIHNVINQNDIVPWVGTTEMGFIRYGVDHYVPGSTDTQAPYDGSDNNRIPEDNTAWDVEGSSYQSQRSKMLAQLAAVNPDIVFDDYFHQATVNYIMGLYVGSVDPISETGRHEDQIGTTEHFIDFFFRMLQDYAFKYNINGDTVDENKWTPRQYFSGYPIENERTFQQAAAATASLIFGKSDEDVAGLMDCFGGLTARLDAGQMLSLYTNLDHDGIPKLKSNIDDIWNTLTIVSEEDMAKGYRPIGDFLTDEEEAELRACYKSLLFPLLCFAAEDYTKYSQDILGTMAYNIPRIISNHYPEVTHAWLRSYDSFYTNDTNPVTMAATSVSAPSAVAVEVTHSDYTTNTFDPTAGTINVLSTDIVRLVPADEADRDTGEAIYYQFTSGVPAVQVTHAFADPFHLDTMQSNYSCDGTFTLKAVAAHSGVKLEPVTITLTLIPTAATYSVTIADGITGGVVTADKANALEGDTVTLIVTPYEGYIVNSVTVNGNAADKVDDTRYTFTMPAEDVAVTAVFKRVFADGIGEKLAGYSLSLDGDIGVNFYMELDQSVVNDTGAHMHFTLPDGSTSDVYLTDTDNCRIDTTTFPGKTYYVFKCNVAAKEMTDTIRAQIVLGNGSSGTLYEYSVKQYAEAITARESENTVLCNLVDAMLYFGTVSQNAFGHNTENPANGGKGYTGAEWNYNSSFEKPDLTNEGIEYYGSSLMLETKVSERHYFKVTGDINDFAFTIDGKSVVPVQYEGDPYYWYIQSDQIKAEDLGKSFKIEVIKGTKTIISYDYSPMDYVSLIFVKYDTTNNWHIQAKALYWYWKAAAAYRAAYPSQA